jgi:hypothetical protein
MDSGIHHPRVRKKIFTFHQEFFSLSDESASWVSFETGAEWILRLILAEYFIMRIRIHEID